MLFLIAAVDNNRAIGFNGDQLAYIREDLLHFRELTRGHTVVMGRRTNEALPKQRLPNRRNIVVTRQQGWNVPEGVETARSVDEALAMAADDGDVFVIGGAQIYDALIARADKLYLTIIDTVFSQADTFFPDYSQWNIEQLSPIMTDAGSGLAFRFATFVRNKE